MLANRISFALGLTGPSFVIDVACSAAANALNLAYRAIKTGECDAALVCGANLVLSPKTSIVIGRSGAITLNDVSRPFDQDASGYVRSDTAAVLFLQKAKDAKRVYATILHSKTNCDGRSEEGNLFPSSERQKELFTKVYEELSIDPKTVNYVEAHCTGNFLMTLSYLIWFPGP